MRRVSLVLLISAAAFAQSGLPAAPGARAVTISPPERRGNEPSIAVNPKNPSQVVAVYQPASVSYSTDGGRTFTPAELPPVEGWRGGGDVSVTFDNRGAAFLGTLHFDRLGTASYWAHNAGRNGIFVRRSLDGGRTWEKDAAAVKAWHGNEPDIEWEDMPQGLCRQRTEQPFRRQRLCGLDRVAAGSVRHPVRALDRRRQILLHSHAHQHARRPAARR